MVNVGIYYFSKSSMKSKIILVVPFTGLGLWGGFRGNRWLRNRIAIFERFVLPSILNQSDRDFVLWFAWRREERFNTYVKEFEKRLKNTGGLVFKFTYTGVPMYDDKYNEVVARERLANTLHGCLHELLSLVSDCDQIYLLLQPSDDCYHRDTVRSIRAVFESVDADAVSYRCGYICNYSTLETKEYSPTTNPPFAAIRFSRAVFFDPAKHLQHISLKTDVGKYKSGTPLPSHEYLPHCLKTVYLDNRGFLVGCHGENISTHFNHPYAGARAPNVLPLFGLAGVSALKLPPSLRKWIMRHLPHQWRRKIRYWFGELFAHKIYNWIRD